MESLFPRQAHVSMYVCMVSTTKQCHQFYTNFNFKLVITLEMRKYHSKRFHCCVCTLTAIKNPVRFLHADFIIIIGDMTVDELLRE